MAFYPALQIRAFAAWLLAAVLALLALTVPARADDISAAGRGVVRIVTIATAEGEVVGFGHGSGFAVAPNRVLTNAHVVEAAERYPGNVMIGIVPSEGDKSYQGRLIAIDSDRDLALVEFGGIRLPPLTFYNGPVSEGDAMIALGYPAHKLKWYRGGMQDWKSLGLTTVPWKKK